MAIHRLSPSQFETVRDETGRDGFGLAAALLAILLIAALLTGVFFVTIEETKTGIALAARQMTLSSAESALESAVSGFPVASARALEIGGTLSTAGENPDGAATIYITRLDSTLFLIVAAAGEGAHASGATRRISLFVSLPADVNGSTRVDRISDRAWSELF